MIAKKEYIVVSDLPSGTFFLSGLSLNKEDEVTGRWSPEYPDAVYYDLKTAKQRASIVGGDVVKASEYGMENEKC